MLKIDDKDYLKSRIKSPDYSRQFNLNRLEVQKKGTLYRESEKSEDEDEVAKANQRWSPYFCLLCDPWKCGKVNEVKSKFFYIVQLYSSRLSVLVHASIGTCWFIF